MTNSSPTDPIREALENLIGQVEQARDGFGIWPYEGSPSMQTTLDQARAAISSMPTIAGDEERAAKAVMAVLWRKEQYNGVGPDYDTYRVSMGGRVASYEREALECARAALQTLSPEHIRRGIDE